jgi:hypothetical protein
MSKLIIKDNVLAPDEKIMMTFKGQNPFILADKMRSNMKTIFEVASKDITQNKFEWDASSKEREFNAIWTMNRKEDNWTKTEVKFITQGKMDSETKKGSGLIVIVPKLITEINKSNFIQKALWNIYGKFFYNKQRQDYIEKIRKEVFFFRETVTKQMGTKRPKSYLEEV